jgi:hypothetical protein
MDFQSSECVRFQVGVNAPDTGTGERTGQLSGDLLDNAGRLFTLVGFDETASALPVSTQCPTCQSIFDVANADALAFFRTNFCRADGTVLIQYEYTAQTIDECTACSEGKTLESCTGMYATYAMNNGWDLPVVDVACSHPDGGALDIPGHLRTAFDYETTLGAYKAGCNEFSTGSWYIDGDNSYSTCTNDYQTFNVGDWGHLCPCAAGFYGPTCTVECDPGFYGATCETDACASNPCKNGATCEGAAGGGYTCACAAGYSGTDCVATTTAAGTTMPEDTTTAAGTTMLEDTTTAAETSTVEETDACATDPCKNGATCTGAAGGGYTCACAAGYSGDLCDTDDLCAALTCQNGATCGRATGGATAACDCAAGYSGDLCETDELCAEVTCQNGGACLHAADGATAACDCAEGFGGPECATAGAKGSEVAILVLVCLWCVVGGVLLLFVTLRRVRRPAGTYTWIRPPLLGTVKRPLSPPPPGPPVTQPPAPGPPVTRPPAPGPSPTRPPAPGPSLARPPAPGPPVPRPPAPGPSLARPPAPGPPVTRPPALLPFRRPMPRAQRPPALGPSGSMPRAQRAPALGPSGSMPRAQRAPALGPSGPLAPPALLPLRRPMKAETSALWDPGVLFLRGD